MNAARVALTANLIVIFIDVLPKILKLNGKEVKTSEEKTARRHVRTTLSFIEPLIVAAVVY